MKLTHHDSLMKGELVTARFWDLIKIRLPWLVVGLLGSFIASIIVSQFETTLRETITLAFFIPIIANMSDGVGTQTETILIRALSNLKFSIPKYILREAWVGSLMGAANGILTAPFAYIVSGSMSVALVVGLSLFLAMTVAAVAACLTPIIFKSLGKDPAVATGPFTTSLQDAISLSIYLLVAVIIL